MKNRIRKLSRRYANLNLQAAADWVVDQSIAIQQIPAPTFAEAERAAYVLQQFEGLGLQEVHQDELHNVYGLFPGDNPDLPGLMIMAHTDTVFPAATDLTLKRKAKSLHAPGLGDNSVGVGGILGLAHCLNAQNIRPACNLWFVATSREEGLGNLDGARLAFDTLRERIDMVINVEGLAYGYIYHAGIAVRRIQITARAEGGHSWLHFGRASATHAVVRLGTAILEVTPPETPRTTYNIGIIEGGHSINSIAIEASLWLDMRSEDTATLAQLEDDIRERIHSFKSDGITIEVNLVGDRPTGAVSPQHPLITGAMAALEETGTQGVLQIGSTDGNIPLSEGCPTVTIGITRGGNAHRLDEFIEVEPITRGLRQLLLLTLSAAEHLTESAPTPSRWISRRS